MSRRCKNKSPAYESRSAGHAESGIRIAKKKESSHVGLLRTRMAQCNSRKITCFTPMVREMCSSNNLKIASWNRWNGKLSQSPWSLKRATSICALVRKGVVLGAVQEKDPG